MGNPTLAFSSTSISSTFIPLKSRKKLLAAGITCGYSCIPSIAFRLTSSSGPSSPRNTGSFEHRFPANATALSADSTALFQFEHVSKIFRPGRNCHQIPSRFRRQSCLPIRRSFSLLMISRAVSRAIFCCTPFCRSFVQSSPSCSGRRAIRRAWCFLGQASSSSKPRQETKTTRSKPIPSILISQTEQFLAFLLILADITNRISLSSLVTVIIL